MSKLIGKLAALVAYICVATMIAQVSAMVYLRSTGRLSDEKVAGLKEAFFAEPAKPLMEEPKVAAEDPSLQEEPSLDDKDGAHDLAQRNLELREQSVKSGLDRILYEKNVLVQERDRYELIKKTFEEQLAALREGALSSGRESVRLIWENIKPKQAKEQILMMLEDNELNEVVTILTAMPISKRAKIVSEFKTAAEAEKLDAILQQILEGVPEVNLIDETDRLVEPKAMPTGAKK